MISKCFDMPDGLGLLMVALVFFVALCVGSFARRYMKGDIKYRAFFIQLIILTASVSLMVTTDEIMMLFMTWCLNNALLVSLMIHKPRWRAAKASGILAATNYLVGASCMLFGLVILYFATGHTSIKAIVEQHQISNWILLALVLLLVAAMAQSGIWPFHRWLISSLNSPTPVSAMMHAGLVNGGGFLLARFAHMYLQYGHLMTSIFVLGMLTAVLGTIWKLIQTDVKRMLACSTMSQMGFMFAQCGMGLFSAAVAHLALHGLFKAYLFLSSGSASKEQRFDMFCDYSLSVLYRSILCGIFGACGFAFATGQECVLDTRLILLWLSFLISIQFAIAILSRKDESNLCVVIIATASAGLFYGYTVHFIVDMTESIGLMQPQALSIYHILGAIIMTIMWLVVLLLKKAERQDNDSSWRAMCYVVALNASQPASKTVTACRKHYEYL
ncbi:proton-conducting membrane transporter [Rickettsiales endosymbiont of Peranema trichophorum]|uniref:proton-conducting transporter transmembrane domain-containing protein n=1 Tax=Rickettsiales endosymbiont of Peranema trichophorum TaxID=2486577 RepID=UPI0010233C72|nr:proton-conducting transporter membrane subunit [Rickettsiales endosymbiont of Peranema trichophorum]RZI46364.1 proton-conducting membrane transporter [Rickettsiales endosymbiont of Peranema trichophorum]